MLCSCGFSNTFKRQQAALMVHLNTMDRSVSSFTLRFLLLNTQDTGNKSKSFMKPLGLFRLQNLLALLTHEQDEAGPLVELHGVGLAELQHRPGVPGEEAALGVVQHLHAALSRDHVTFRVKQDQRGNT